MSFVIANVKFSSALWHQIHVIMLAAAAALVFFLLVEVGSAAVRSLVRRARRPAPAASVAKAELYAVAAEPAPAMPAPDDDGEHDDFSWEPVVIPMPATTAAPAVNSLAPPVQ
ncbi:MAG: hypothetical protein ACREQ5_10945, partial [Candidatus Dormibacteria bacterium]